MYHASRHAPRCGGICARSHGRQKSGAPMTPRISSTSTVSDSSARTADRVARGRRLMPARQSLGRLKKARRPPTSAVCTAMSSQPSSPQLSRICLVLCGSRGTVTYSHLVIDGWGEDGWRLPDGEGAGSRGPAPRSTGCGSARVTAQELPPLVLVEAAPDPVRLADQERVLAALGEHRALVADGLRRSLACEPLILAFEMARCKEQVGLWSLAGGPELPADLKVP